MNKKIGILTFHASHNFGSMLQAFALQQVLRQWGYESEIINFRSAAQRTYCSGIWNMPVKDGRSLLRKLLLFPFRKPLREKYAKFENFLKTDLACSPIYKTSNEVLEKPLPYRIYITGSDQIWHVGICDFSWLYFLPFTADKKIAYAPSLGDTCTLTYADQEKIKHYLADFTAISVREESGADLLGSFTTRPAVTLDPTLLLSAQEWEKHIDKTPLVKTDYLFVYAPGRNPRLLQAIPHNTKLTPVVSSNISWYALYSPRYIKCLNTGPWDFLNLIYHSKGVVSGSFHAAVFAKLFNKPLYCIDMGPGSRIANLEEKFKYLEEERSRSMKFLKEALQDE